ncbi:MAG: phosphoenolpyruvate carboxykinase [Candidatus Omnitrophota bacterium]
MSSFQIFENKVILRIKTRICETADELLESELFRVVLDHAVRRLVARRSVLLRVFDTFEPGDQDLRALIETLRFLAKMPGSLVPNVVPGGEKFFRDPGLLNDFVEYLYNYWRSFDRFIICDSTGTDLHRRPSKTFNNTIEQLTHLARGTYRDIEENITDRPPRTYRQVRAGAEAAVISLPLPVPLPGGSYQKLLSVPVIRQMLLYPPLILNPPQNKRSGKFARVMENPLEDLPGLEATEWLCYPAKVGELTILIYFHQKFYELGFSLCNLFEIANDEDLEKKPDAVYVFGVPGGGLKKFGDLPSVFYEDETNAMMVAAVPGEDHFGYFGYLKKMVLTLHNILMMKRGRLPFHGALVRLILKGDYEKTVLFIGDTGAGKSETLEALRTIGSDQIQDMTIVADDMGSLGLGPSGEILGYGTEIGAFLRLDDLQPGYAFGQMDRAVIMSPNKVNARIVLPVTSFENVVRGFSVDMVLYANNYEQVDEEHPILEKFHDPENALKVFRAGAVMSKGTTTSTGIVHSYFANIFGPAQYKELHDECARRFFGMFFEKKIAVGQIRTRLGISGNERSGPEAAAQALLEALRE